MRQAGGPPRAWDLKKKKKIGKKKKKEKNAVAINGEKKKKREPPPRNSAIPKKKPKKKVNSVKKNPVQCRRRSSQQFDRPASNLAVEFFLENVVLPKKIRVVLPFFF